jgi:signal transduction histidine kinase
MVALFVLALVVSLPFAALRTPQAAVVEWGATITIAAFPEPASGNMMLYLLAPASALGMLSAVRWLLVACSIGVGVGLWLILRSMSQFDQGSIIDLVQWSALALALGLLANWIQRQREASTDSPMRTYEEALRLLTDLESISRRLPTGLDVGTIATQILQDAMAAAGSHSGVLVTSTTTGETRVAASIPEQDNEWLRSRIVAGAPTAGDTTSSVGLRERSRRIGLATAAEETELIEPLLVGDRQIGLLAMRVRAPASPAVRDEVSRITRAGSIPLEASLLFSSVRDTATNEERSRIAREIHDGIAQDIAFLGYAADEIVELSDDPEIRRLTEDLRREISRVVTELRTSVRTLREDVNPEQSLGASLVDFARRVLHDTHTQVHVSVEESPQRLRPDVESELRRIAQEAINNARRHARAQNLWLSCVVEPPHATVVVEDDGVGLGGGREDSYGLDIMGERARRILAELSVEKRPDGGTVVRVTL